MTDRRRKERKIARDTEEGLADTFGANEPSLRSRIVKFITGKDDDTETRRKAAQKARESRRRRGR
jgi:hypothetical protein